MKKPFLYFVSQVAAIPFYVRQFGFRRFFLLGIRFILRPFLPRYWSGREERSAPPPDAFTRPLGKNSARLLRPRCVIIAELSIPQCKMYRVDQKVDMFRAEGWETEVVSWRDSDKALLALQTATMVIAYRIPYTTDVKRLYDEAHRLGLQVGFDIDDLVFDVEEYSKNSNLLSLPREQRRGLLVGAELYRDALAAADFSIASTPALQVYMRKYCAGPSYVVPNALPLPSSEAHARFALGLGGETIIGYGSGTTTHDRDFELCAGAVLRILDEFPKVVLAIHGTLRLPNAFDRFLPRIRRVPFVPFAEYSSAVARFDVNLAPLEAGVFNDCKSNIKFLEAARNEVPTVASPRAEFVAAIRSGENGFLAETEGDWYAAIKTLVSDAECSMRFGAAAKRTAVERYSIAAVRTGDFSMMLRAHGVFEQGLSRRRFLVVNCLYAPVSFGGATIFAENLAGEFAKTSDVAVFTESMSPYRGVGQILRYEHNGVTCFVYETEPPKDVSRNYLADGVSAGFRRVIEAFRPDMVHFNSIQFMGVEMLDTCRDMGIPYVVTAHDAWWLCPRQFMLDAHNRYCGQDEFGIDLYRCASCTGAKDLFPRWRRLTDALLHAAAVLTPSDYQRDLYVKSGLPANLIRTNRNGIVVPASVSPHVLHSPITFAYLGGRCDHKGYFMIQRLAKLLHGEYRLKLVDIHLRFGKPSISAIEWSAPSRIECCPPFDPSGINDFYEGVDVLLFPSCWKESFGLTVREALARNVWVVATDAGGDLRHDLKDGENGNLVPFGDEKGFCAAMQALIDDPQRLSGYENPYRSEVRTIAEQARETIDYFERALVQ